MTDDAPRSAGLFAAAARSVSWTLGAGVIVRILGFVSTAIAARILTPADYGLVALAMSLWYLFESFFAFGVESYIIREKDPPRAVYDTAWTLNLIRGAVFAFGIVAAAPSIASGLGDERLGPMLYAVAAIAFLSCARNTGFVDYSKSLKFSYEFGAVVIGKFLSILVTIALAVSLRSYWALLFGVLAAELWHAGYTYAAHPFRPRMTLSRWRDLFSFAGWLTLGRAAFSLSVKFDAILLQKTVGTDAVGVFTVGRSVAAMPTNEMIYPVNKALFPALAKAAARGEALKSAHLEALALITSLALPAGIGLAIVAPDAVRALLGAQWDGAVPVVQMIGAGFAVLTIATNFDAVMMTAGRMQLYAWRGVIFAVLRIAVFLGGLFLYGLYGAAAGFALGCVIQAIIDTTIMNRVTGATWGDAARRIWRSLIASAAMTAALFPALAVAPEAGGGGGALMRLAVLAALGATTYAVVHFALWRLSGRPEGPETRMLFLFRTVFPRS
ncbi:MAG: lipopolysaccharide biosynthesis protein [Pseudomonadota bacterium]